MTTPFQISTLPDRRAFWQTVELAGTVYRLRMVWRARTRSWYLDIYAADETPIITGQRLSPGWDPLEGLSVPGAPEVTFYVVGPEPYAREDLEDGLALRLVTNDDLPSISSQASGLTVTIT